MSVNKIKLNNIEHIEFYVPNKRMTLAQAFSSHTWHGRKCDHMCNGTLFDMGTSVNSTITYGATQGKQVGFLFCNYGILFDNNRVSFGDLKTAIKNKCDLIGGAPHLAHNSEKDIDWGNRKPSTQVTGAHVRTALGITKDSVVMYTSNSEITLDTLAQIMLQQGCTYAINLDGGGSSCMIVNGSFIRNSTRPLANFIMIWTKKTKSKGDDEMVQKEKINVDGKEVEVTSIIKNGETYVPLRQLGELLGASVGYDAKTKKKSLTTKKDNTTSYNPVVTQQKIWIDAGHSTISPGAHANGIKEEDYVLKVALELGKLLSASGFRVYYTRRDGNPINKENSNADLLQRCKEANKLGVDYFISLHNNAFSGANANGIEVLVHDETCLDAVKLANTVLRELIDCTGMYNRGIKYRPDLCVLRETNMTAILCELGFLTNQEDSKKLKSYNYHKLLANAIYKGIIKYVGGNANG